MKYPLVIFDWDGTLMDSVGRIVSSMQRTAAILKLPEPTVTAVREIIGISLEPAIETLFGRLSASQFEQFMTVYRQQYVHDDITPSPLFTGARDTLETLRERGYTLAVATGKARHGLERVWEEADIRHLFHTSRCADETASKPNPKMLLDILAETGFRTDQAVMIGDSVHDMRMAENAQMARIGVSFGAHDAKRLQNHQPLAIIDQLSELNDHV
ncbi:HAD-IA family hydrolase [Pseudidiomarina marina]|uniref:HAD family hydrolase n=1 Tax=Pseudidiomarina marina TaxID=502366 RepID=A0A432YK04_9GAMM|nr:HAD-IA family hydrolase [Pseudidiomarina marina]RUO61256.1 HAD family hydrolase [Pseudidiomarina marina]